MSPPGFSPDGFPPVANARPHPGADEAEPSDSDPLLAASDSVENHTPDRTVNVTATDSAFSRFYQDSWDHVARGLAATLGDRHLAAEATDEAMARAYQRWAKISTYDSPAGWVYRVGLNWARSYHRRLARSLPLRRAEHAELGAIADPAVHDALMALDIKHRTVVVCRLLLDWSVTETAEALHIAPGTVKSRLSRATNILESTLGHMR